MERLIRVMRVFSMKGARVEWHVARAALHDRFLKSHLRLAQESVPKPKSRDL